MILPGDPLDSASERSWLSRIEPRFTKRSAMVRRALSVRLTRAGVRAPALVSRTDNARRTIADRFVKRGSILDSHERSLAESSGSPGSIMRQYPYAALGPLVGY